ncbi:AAA family ATPase [endosymbiont GvMRE of Glomus versiforme]|uniref:AAA family ATPase n=1 Tax=endosymbiont GvMRE of Glomus versiforme TaxID=2039283 RepID=UPI000EBF7106|nr:AAA family ATPase [endosymbiont GvMRE of Glomus versiforme]RHZ35513.1 ATP-dependent zinc metalloprotease FtsH [endosymbiont GvMRE of Glomus versiforme]
MKEAQTNTKQKVVKVDIPKRRGLLFWLILLTGGIIFLFSSIFSAPDRRNFELRKKESSDDTIKAYGLKEKEVDKIDWQKGTIYTYHHLGNNKQHLFYNKRRNFFEWLTEKKVIYQAFTEMNVDEIKDKKIEFDGFSIDKRITIPKIKLFFSKYHDMFFVKNRKLEKAFSFVFQGIYLIIMIHFIDIIFGTNFINLITYPFRTFKDNNQRINTISNIKFKNVGGLHEAKEELKEIVSYFHNPQLFWQRGAVVPKGILLVGPPGNGKTLLAKSLAGECNLPFLFRAGSEFEEALVGTGARRVRSLFEKARSYPQGCIIFIDEIDSIGYKRYSMNTNHTEQTLNQLLNELDGFKPRDNIIIVAATNSLKVLDKSLIRPGRFDRQIYIPLPNSKGRQEIIKLCIQKLTFKHKFDLEEITSMTKGLSGAQIVNMFNEASILSIRYKKESISQEIIFESYDRVLMGPSLTSHTISYEKKKVIAYHEAGHAIIGLSLPETVVKKITILPHLMSGGYTWVDLYGESGDDYLLNKGQILANVMSCLGGRASEELIFGEDCVTIGAYDDFKKASESVRDFIFRYGMSELGIIPTKESFFYKEESLADELPESTKQKIENERTKILDKCWTRVKSILQKKKKILDLFAEILLKKNTLYREEINYIFVNHISPFVSLLTKK